MRRLLVLSVLSVLSVASSQDLNLATIYESQNQWGLARDIVAEYLRTKPFDVQVYRRYAALAVKLEDYSGLVSFTDSLLARNPAQPNLLMGRAEGFIRGGRKSDGVAVLDNLLKQNIETAQQVGTVFEGTGLDREAIRVYNEYRRRRSNPTIFATSLLTLYEKTGDYPAATREAVTLMNVDPNLAGEYERKFQSYALRGRLDPIVTELKDIKDKAVRSAILAKVYIAAGHTKEALAEIEALDSYQKALEFARYCEQAGYLDAALELYGKFTTPPLPYDRARVLRKLGRILEAVAILEKSDDPVARFELAEVQRVELNDPASAAANYRKVVAVRPDHIQAWYGLSDCLIRLDRMNEADQALAAMPKPTDRSLYDRARIAFYNESFDSSSSRVQQLLQQFPQSPLANDGLELLVLTTRGGEGLKSFAPIMRDYALARYDSAIVRCQTIIRSSSQGSGPASDSGSSAVGSQPSAENWADQAYILLADCYSARKEYNQALAALDELEKQLPASSLRAKARYRKALVYLSGLKDEPQYSKTMESVYNDFPDSPYAALARNLMIPTSKPKE
jgi:tetratricopeptide (TPR) repeat protein